MDRRFAFPADTNLYSSTSAARFTADEKLGRPLAWFVAMSAVLILMVLGLAQWQHAPVSAADDVGSILFHNG